MKRMTIGIGLIAAVLGACASSPGDGDQWEAANEMYSSDSTALESDEKKADGNLAGATFADLDEGFDGEPQDEEVDVSLEFAPIAALDTALPGEVVAASYADCPAGNICFFNETRGRGDMCRWTEHDTDWNAGATTCSWAKNANVCSVWNRTSWRMEYFEKSNYNDRVGSTTAGKQGDLACSYKLASHRKQF